MITAYNGTFALEQFRDASVTIPIYFGRAIHSGSNDYAKMIPLKSAWGEYEKWNDAIAREIFNENAAGQPVYLDLEEDVLARAATQVGLDPGSDPANSLIESVRATLCRPTRSEAVFGAHTAAARLWKLKGDSTPPPCIGLLAVLSLVAEEMRRSEEFAGSNYYGRLAKVLDAPSESLNRLTRDFRRQTPFLWDTLNGWLEDSNGAHGFPTAIAFDHRRYIGLPISQALVRAQDRMKLPGLFAQAGLQPSQRISVHAMHQLLDDWLASSQGPNSFRRLWSKRATRERISEIACAELEGWDGTIPGNVRPPGYKHDDNLLLGAELRTHPRPAVDLLLVTRQKGQENSGMLTLSPAASSTALSALGPLGDAMRLEAILGTAWASIEPSYLMSCPELLVSNVSLEAPFTEGTYSRRARRLVVLKKYEADHLFVEARRAELLETYLILVVSQLAPSVREVLQSVARAGFRELGHESLRGLPPDWVAFASVQLEKIPCIAIDDLRPLQPLARTHLALGEGLPLPGMNVWHRGRLPELRIVVGDSSAAAPAEVRAAPIRYLDGSETSDIDLGIIEGAGIVGLSRAASALSDGDFRLIVSSPHQNRTLATASLRVRSGSWPRRLDDSEEPRIAHSLSSRESVSFFGKSITEAADTSTGLVGASLGNEECFRRAERTNGLPPLPSRPGVVLEELEQEDWDPIELLAETPEGELPICFQRAHHYWLLEAKQGNAPVFSVCKDCGQEKWWEPERKRKRSATAVEVHRELGPRTGGASQPPPLPTISEREQADMDLMLDALSYGRSGSWRTFQAIAASIDDAPWFSHEAARRLEALGHLELEFDQKSLQPKRWMTAPPTIVVPEYGPAFLAGSRSARLVRAVVEVVGILDGTVRDVSQRNGPSVVEIHGLDTDGLQLAVDCICEERKLALRLSTRPASRIAAVLPTLSSIRESLPDLTTSANRYERFDVPSGRWLSADRIDRAGAYRLRTRPWIYSVAPKLGASDRRPVIADVRLAKHLAAGDESFSLIGYDEPSQTLLASQGAPLPGLLERTAVLCSGRLPILRPDKTLAYEGVPLKVAEAIWEAIASRN